MKEKKSQTKKTEEQENNSKDWLRPWQFKPGQSGNPGGRPKGTISLKEYAKKYLQELDEDGKREFMEGLDKDVIWKMAEGNPKQDTEVKGNLTISQVLDELENGSTTKRQNVADEPLVQDQEQEGAISTVHTEPSAN
jgi:hypothetical protein